MRRFAAAGHSVWYLPAAPRSVPDEQVRTNLTVVHEQERFFASIAQLPRPHLLWAGWPLGLRLPPSVQPDWTVLDMGCGILSGMPVKPDFLERTNLVLTSSTGELDRLRRLAPQAIIRLLPNGTQFTPQLEAVRPSATRVRLGVVGSLGYWLDAALLEQISMALPDAEVNLLPVPSVLSCQISRPPSLSNIRLRGESLPSAVPDLIRGLHAIILPWAPNPVSATTPLSLCDFLAVGLPVVTLSDPEAEDLRPLVYNAGTPTGFQQAIQEALAEEGRHESARREYARRSSWEARFAELTGLLRQH